MTNGASMLTSFLGALLLIATVLAVPWIAADIESGESSIFTVGGLSLEPVAGIDADADVLGTAGRTQTNGGASVFSDGSVFFICEGGVGLTRTVMVATVTNLSTNLSVFGEEYASVVLDRPAAECDPQASAVPGVTADLFQLQVFWNVDRGEIFDSEVLSIVINGDSNATMSGFSVDYLVADGPGTLTVALTDIYEVEPLQACTTCAFGTPISVPLTTQDRLSIQGLDPSDGNDAEYIRWIFFFTAGEMPDDGEVLIFDEQVSKTRDGLLNAQNRLIFVNVVGGTLILIGAALALPRVTIQNIFRGGGMRGDKNGVGSGVSIMTVVVVLLVALVLLWFFGGDTTFADTFTVSILPLFLAVLAFSLVAFTTQGRTQRPFALVLAGLSGIFSWLVGVAIQNSWVDFDRLYVRPTVDLFSGNLTGATFFEATAAYVVIAIVIALGVMTFNVLSTIGTDERIKLFR